MLCLVMKMNHPVGNPLYAPVFIRLTLGAYFVLAGLMKLQNPQAFVDEIKKFGILKDPILTLYGILLPYFEIGCGTMLIIGVFTTLAAILTSLMLISFIVALKLFPSGGHLFNKDVVLLAASLSLLWSGAGFFSIDHFRKTGA